MQQPPVTMRDYEHSSKRPMNLCYCSQESYEFRKSPSSSLESFGALDRWRLQGRTGLCRRKRLPWSLLLVMIVTLIVSVNLSEAWTVSRLYSHNGQSIFDMDNSKVPKHIAFVCDGNSRWAAARNSPSVAGHSAGAGRLVEILDLLKNIHGVEYCTMYGFSAENWNRPEQECSEILAVMEATARKFYNRAKKEKIAIKIIGDLEDKRIPMGLKEILEKLEKETSIILEKGKKLKREEAQLTLCLAINYGGRPDILNASKRLAQMVADDAIDIDSVTEDDFASLLSTGSIPDPDLIIRTSGECRLSNFLLWNAAYAELYFTDTLWPDFDETDLAGALTWYTQRKRRFGSRQTAAIAPSRP